MNTQPLTRGTKVAARKTIQVRWEDGSPAFTIAAGTRGKVVGDNLEVKFIGTRQRVWLGDVAEVTPRIP